MTTVEKILVAPKKIREAAEAAAEQVLCGDPDPLLVNQAQAAKMWNCSRFTIKRATDDGTLHPVTIRGMKRYRVSELRSIAGE